MAEALSIRGVSKHFPPEQGSRPVLALTDISLEVKEKEFYVLLGPSGCGKSTLLRIIAGLEHQNAGVVSFGKDVARETLGFVFQHFALLPWLTVEENVALGLIGRGIEKTERTLTLREELHRFGLQQFASSYPHQLSGGMQQRVGLARAFAVKPSLLLLDEPFSELDSFTAKELRLELLKLWEERGVTVLMVTHIIPEALQLADRIAILTGRPGTVQKIVQNTLPRPRNLRSPEFFELEDQIEKIIKP